MMSTLGIPTPVRIRPWPPKAFAAICQGSVETFRLQRLVYMYVFGLISSELHCLVPRETIPRLLLPVLVRLSCTSKRFRAIVPKLREGGRKKV